MQEPISNFESHQYLQAIPNVRFASVSKIFGIPNLSAENLAKSNTGAIRGVKSETSDSHKSFSKHRHQFNNRKSVTNTIVEKKKQKTRSQYVSIIDKLRNGDANV